RAAAVRPFHLIETMRFHPDEGMALLGHHMQRLAASAERLGFTCNHHEIRNFLQVLVGRETRPRRVKLTLARDGAHAISITDLPATSVPMDVVVVPLPVDADDWRLSHKVSDRDFYDISRRNAGTDEVLFHRPDGLLTEGSFTSLFVKRDGRLLTPRLETGLLPGVLRADLIEKGDAIEADLTADDLDGEIFVGNALRGLVPAVLVARRKDAA
ncbi:MAG: aminotransferase class IV, partial [Pseudomonadota bacterium]